MSLPIDISLANLLCLSQIWFIVFKLTGYISWPWWLVLLPVILILGSLALLLISEGARFLIKQLWR
jgi:hypothetical protein